VISSKDLTDTPVDDSRTWSEPGPSGGHILYTSGTTGAYRKLLWNSDLEEARSSERGRFQGFDQSTVAHILRCEQQTGIGWKIPLAVWQAGGCVVMDQRAERYQKLFRNSPTYVFMTPLMFRQLMSAEQFDCSGSTKCDIRVGGGIVGVDLIGKALARFREPVNLYHGYASTELVISVLASHLRTVDDAQWLEPVGDRTVEVVDDSGRECLAGHEGDIRIRLTELDWHEYLDDGEATAKVFRDGFFYPGDRAIRRADGRIHVLGRVADVLNVQGEKIAVGPVEQRIKHYLGAEEVCAFSRRNGSGQDELVVVIQTNGRPAEDKLDAIRRDFSGFDAVRFAVLREFPRNESGMEKTNRIALRELVFSETDSSSVTGPSTMVIDRV
jgi:acyl-coenzyme A synthetase/AMP-(fatty) acid ligase